jgi:prepilin-type N-terminal cleavage/methylation domain-containing protein
MMRRQAKKRGGQRGFTLLELLIALNILMIGLLTGVFPMQLYAIQMNRVSFQRSVATELAHETLDNFHIMTTGNAWSSVTSDPAGFVGGAGVCPAPPHADDPNNPLHKHSIVRNGTTYTRVWSVTATGQANVNLVTVFVYWTPSERKGTEDLAPDAETCVHVQVSSYKYCNLGDGKKGFCE